MMCRFILFLMATCLLAHGCVDESSSSEAASGSEASNEETPSPLTGEAGGELDQRNGPLCIGLTPADENWLEPEPDVLDEDTNQTDTEIADADGQTDEQARDAADSTQEASDTEDADPDGLDSALFAIFVEPESDARAESYDTESDTQEEDSGASTVSPQLPPIQGPGDEEEEPYDCIPAPNTCLGAAAPEFALYDFQPQSCGYKATYGLNLYENHVTVVALLAAW